MINVFRYLIVLCFLLPYKSQSYGQSTENDFTDTHIQLLKNDSININLLSKETYYRSILTKNHLLEFEESSFYKGNFIFSLTKSMVKNYGLCYIGKYYFPDAVNSAQRRSTVIINPDRKEISIWDFENVTVL